jgi:hypothetical protein
VSRTDRGRCTSSACAGTDGNPKRVTRAGDDSTWTDRAIDFDRSGRERIGTLADPDRQGAGAITGKDRPDGSVAQPPGAGQVAGAARGAEKEGGVPPT